MPLDLEHLTTPERASDLLADALGSGTLVLHLGAGTSRGAGLPAWPELIRRLRTYVALDTSVVGDRASADELQNFAQDARRAFRELDSKDRGALALGGGSDDREFAQLVKRCLYAGVDLSPALVTTEVLIALGALLMGSRRGHVSRIMTLNFDSTLEWYLSLHGLIPRIVIDSKDLEGSEDVRIYHAHGFLSHPDQQLTDSDLVILDMQSVNERLGAPHDPWLELMRHTLSTGFGLFVGLSFRSFKDRAMAPLLANIRKTVGDIRPTGVWICVRESEEFASATSIAAEEASQRAAFLDENVIPVFLDLYSEIPAFILSVCQKAAIRAKQQLTPSLALGSAPTQ